MRLISRRTFIAEAGFAASLHGCSDVRSLNVLLFNIRDEVNLVANQLSEFSTKKKISANLHPTDYDAIRKTIATDKFDVIYVDDVWMSEFAHARKIIPLNDYIGYHVPEFEFDFSDKIRDDMASIAEGDGKDRKVTHWMMPQRADVQVLYFNKAIFSDSSVQSAFRTLSGGRELEVPRTWGDYNYTASILKNVAFRGSPIIATAETLAAPHYAFEFFASRYWALSGTGFFDSDTNPTRAIFGGPEGVSALSLIRDVLPYADPGSLTAIHENSIEIFKRGNCALMPQWYSFYAELSNPLDALGDKLGVQLLPGVQLTERIRRAPCLGGGSLAVTSTSNRKPLAWEFVRFFTGMETAAKAAAMGLTTPRSSGYQTLQDKELASPTAVYRKSLDTAIPRPRHQLYAQLESIIGYAVNLALRSPGREAEILLAAQNQCTNLVLRQ